MSLLGDFIILVDLSDKLRSLRVHAEFRRHSWRVRKRNFRSEWLVATRGRTERFRRARDQLSAHFRGHAYASSDEHVAAKSDNRGTGKTKSSVVIIYEVKWFPSSAARCSSDFSYFLFHYLLQTFEFITNEDGSVAYLYNLTSGHVARSFAHAAARSAGLNDKIVRRALEVKVSHRTYLLAKITMWNKTTNVK